MTAGIPEELTARLVSAAGASVTGVEVHPAVADVREVTAETLAARIELGGLPDARYVTARLGAGLALAAVTGAPVRVLHVPGDDPGKRPRFEPRNMAFGDGLDRWDLDGGPGAEAGSGPLGYSAAAEGPCALLSSAAAGLDDSAVLVQAVFADDFLGAAVFSGEFRTEDTVGRAGLCLEILRKGWHHSPDRRENHAVTVTGSQDWSRREIVHAVAPDATLRELLVDPADVSTPAKAAAAFATYVRIAARDGQVISQGGFGLDYNLGENGFTSAEAATINSALEYAAARHVTYVCGSGDQGAIGQGSTPPVKEVTLPADDPLVLGVGGTSLTANPATGAYINETAWYAPPGAKGDYSVGSGGGFSHLFARPAYQDSVPGIGAWRGVPDVAGNASRTRMAYARSAPGGIYQLKPTGGTSASGPLWAGLIALADQEAGHPLGFVNPAIYRIARGPLYHKAFHDITTGANTAISDGITITGCQAGPGSAEIRLSGTGTPGALG